MRYAKLSLAALPLVLLIILPAHGAPSLVRSSQATYHLGITVTLSPFPCLVDDGTETAPSPVHVCPMPATMTSLVHPTISINGTLSWTATSLNTTTVTLSVTHDLETTLDNQTIPLAHQKASFNESINLATRETSILPFIEPEMEAALQTAESTMPTNLPTGTTLTSTLNLTRPIIPDSLAFYTMWWVNGPLTLNQTIPILVFPANVTNSTRVNLGSLGTRAAWILTRPFRLPPELATAYAVPIYQPIGASLAFTYDQKSDLLLTASADMHTGFVADTVYQIPQCANPGAPCTTTASPIIVTLPWGITLHASLTLTSTNLDLDQRLINPDPSNSGTAGSGSSANTGTGANAGTSGGTGTTSSTTPSTGSGQNLGNSGNSGTNSYSNPSGSQKQPYASQFSLGTAINYAMLAAVASVVLTAGVWISRKRINEVSG